MAIHFSKEELNTMSKDALIVLLLSMQSQLSDVSNQLNLLTEQVALMNQRAYGKKSEKAQVTGQLTFSDLEGLEDVFNEAEFHSDDSKEPKFTEAIVSGYTKRKKTSREENLEGLPARIIDHTLSEEELSELFPDGYKELPEEIYKRVSVIPETLLVDEHHVHIYASRKNDGTIVKAKRPADLFRNSIATPSLVALTIHGKFSNHVPIERLSRQFQVYGVNLMPITMSNWVIRASEEYLSLIYDRMRDELLRSHVVHADETPFRLTNKPGEKGKPESSENSRSYMWVYRTARSGATHDVVLYDPRNGRDSHYPEEFLKGFEGTLVSDGYSAYRALQKRKKGLEVSGCWVHVKRKFSELLKAKNISELNRTVSSEAVRRIALIFHLDNQLDRLSPEERKIKREEIVAPKVDDYFAWARSVYPTLPAAGNTAKALKYSINQEQYLRVFLHDGNVPMDNNCAEQAIRPFTLGRKNWTCINSPKGAFASAVCYSIVETAKAHNLRVYNYLEYLLTVLPEHMNDTDLDFLDSLMPWSPEVQAKCHRLNKT